MDSADANIFHLFGSMPAWCGLMLASIQEYLEKLHAHYAPIMEGAGADYIPELSKADPKWFGICIATRDDHVYEVPKRCLFLSKGMPKSRFSTRRKVAAVLMCSPLA
jgi:hypothetical protein